MQQFRYILLSLCLCLFLPALQLYAAADSTLQEVRRFDRKEFNDLQNSRDYRYPDSREEVMSILDRIIKWLSELFDFFDPAMADSGIMKGLGYLLMFALIAVFTGLLIWLLLRSDFKALFTRKSAKVKKEDYEILEDDIHNISYIDEIQKAVNEGNYRRAIRLQYLKTLKMLADNHVITWSIERTNSDFRNMMRARNDYAAFDYLATAYEFVWYGYSSVDAGEYTRLAAAFDSFNQAYREVEA